MLLLVKEHCADVDREGKKGSGILVLTRQRFPTLFPRRRNETKVPDPFVRSSSGEVVGPLCSLLM